MHLDDQHKKTSLQTKLNWTFKPRPIRYVTALNYSSLILFKNEIKTLIINEEAWLYHFCTAVIT